jgi:hypothetical protein
MGSPDSFRKLVAGTTPAIDIQIRVERGDVNDAYGY